MSNEVVTLKGQRHVVWECRTCGVISTCPEPVWDQQQAEGGYHHCSNGHQWGWNKESCEREQLRRERDRLKQQAARLEEEASLSRVRAERAEEANRKLKKRAAAGVCPCCNRTFTNMQRHMKSKHPNVVSLNQKTA